MTAHPDPARADVVPTVCPDCGKFPDVWTSDGHLEAIRCTELAALRAERDRTNREKEQLAILASSMLAGGTDWMQKAHEAQKDAFALQQETAALRARAERAEAALRKYGNHAANCGYVGLLVGDSPCICGFDAALAAVPEEPT